jgi:hypothetical protein
LVTIDYVISRLAKTNWVRQRIFSVIAISIGGIVCNIYFNEFMLLGMAFAAGVPIATTIIAFLFDPEAIHNVLHNSFSTNQKQKKKSSLESDEEFNRDDDF